MIFGTIGQVAIRALLIVVCLSAAIHFTAIRTRRNQWRRWSRFAMVLQFFVTGVASFCLIWLLVTQNDWFSYVAEYTGPGLPMIYRIAAFWGGNAGSLLFWALVLTMYGAVVSFSRHEDSERMLPIVHLILTLIALFYTLVLNFLATPFLKLDHPLVPSGLNPLLQNPGMTVHPVNVYLGFIGFSVPFAYAMTHLILKKTNATWLVVTRRWTLVSWLFLGIGIVYGAHWSYEELGWGGYWAWDPVENASLLPWLTSTAFLHSAIVQEKQGMLKAWNVVLVTLTFLLTLLGTFLTRSGVLWSIHAFANAPLGQYFLTFLAATFVFSAGVIWWRRHSLRADARIEAVVSKESSFLLNNILFLGSAFAVLWGTLFPLVSQAVTGRKMMVDSPFYNSVNLPLAVCILLLMGIGPLIAWRRSSVKRIATVIFYPLLVSVVLGLGISALLFFTFGHMSVLGTLGIIASTFAAATVLVEFYRSVRVRVKLTQEGVWASIWKLVHRNRRRYGGYVVHFSVALIAIGIAASGAFHSDVQTQMHPGDAPVSIAGYDISFDGMGVDDVGPDKRMYGNLIVKRGSQTLGMMQPSATFYSNGQAPSTNVALYSSPFRDLYVVMLGTVGGDSAVFDIHVNPLVQFIWYGGYLLIIGTLISLWPESRQKRLSLNHESTRVLQQLSELEYDFNMGKLSEPEYIAARDEFEHRLRDLKEFEYQIAWKVQQSIDATLFHQQSSETREEDGR